MTTTSPNAGLRSHVLVAPARAAVPTAFPNLVWQPAMREHLIAEMQRLRGKVYLDDGALSLDDLTPDGRHLSDYDDRSWHLLTMGDAGQVIGCVRMIVHPGDARYEQLFASHSALSQSDQWGAALRACIDRERATARRAGAAFLEIGGWALSKEARHSTEAARLSLGSFAFGQLLGGAVGVTTATFRNHSATMLKRIGGQPMNYRGNELPVYFDPQYGCDMAILRFDSESYNPKYRSMVDELRAELSFAPVLCGAEGRIPVAVPVLPKHYGVPAMQAPQLALCA